MFNFTVKFPNILGNISKFILVIADLNENNRLIMSMKQLPLEFLKSVAFFSGTPSTARASSSLLIAMTAAM